MRRVGFVGVGTISQVMVEAIVTGPRREAIEVVLSPRSALRASALARQHPAVRVAVDNQAVLDRSDIVVLAVLPSQVAEVCSLLAFREDHIVVGLAAGWPPTSLTPLVSPASDVCQIIPLPMASLRIGPIVMYPRVEAVADLLDGCGDVIVPDNEAEVISFSCASAMMSAHFEWQLRVIEWLAATGVSDRTAHSYVTSLFLGLATEARASDPSQAVALVAQHETPGGLNAQVRQALIEVGAYDRLVQTLTRMRTERLMRG